MPVALRWAREIIECSPDAVSATKEQINFATMDGLGVREVVEHSARDPDTSATYDGKNQREGLQAFTDVRCFFLIRVVFPFIFHKTYSSV
jgi:enoyl-CoA hydratase/carnithine racemase